MRLFLVISMTALLCGLAPGSALADRGEAELEALVVQMADTPQDHAALADYYRAKASSLRHEAEKHRSMGKRYMSGNMASRNAMKKHCENIAEQSEKVAREYEALAKEHDAQAKE